MTNHDLHFNMRVLRERVSFLEEAVTKLLAENPSASADWDNATLIREWKISERTAANYRKTGLDYYKIGGRLYYTPEQRERFIEESKGSMSFSSQLSGKEVSHEDH